MKLNLESAKQIGQTSEKTAKPEWLRIPEATKLFGISRSKLYELIAAGYIRSTSLRKRGQIKGTRLIDYDSLCRFLETACQNQGVFN
jgi:excisionase family DNA binding protein